MTEESKVANPIVQFIYDSITNGYKTILKDGTEGPFISLNDMFVLKDLVALENEVNVELSTATELRNATTKLLSNMNTIYTDITDYLKIVQAEIVAIKEKVK